MLTPHISLLFVWDELHSFVRNETKSWTKYGYDYITAVTQTAMIVSLEENVDNINILTEIIITTFLSGVYNNSNDESQRQRVLEYVSVHYPKPDDRYRIGINIKTIPNERMLISHGIFCERNVVVDIIVDSIIWNSLLVSNDVLITIDLCVVTNNIELLNAEWLDAVVNAKRIVKTSYMKTLVNDLNIRSDV